MKRHDNLWPRLVSFSNLLSAAENAVRRKRSQANVARFRFDLEKELCQLQDELRDHLYAPGPFHTFEIREPKRRLISAAPLRDRVVHHALCAVLEPVFEPTFIFDSYACRRGKGTHAAVNRFQQFTRRFRYVLKCDVQKYFPSIDHAILTELIARKVKDEDVLWLASVIIEHSNPQEAFVRWFPGDDLFTPSERRRGLPIGNQTSQFFANVYLNPLDHFVKETLRAPAYVRYMDDFVLLADDKKWLAEARRQCRRFLARQLRLVLHPRKSEISRVADGTRFLGFRIFPDHRLLVRRNVVGFRRRLRYLQTAYRDGSATLPEIRQRISSWLGHASHADTWRLRTGLLSRTIFTKQVGGDL
ncbi:MAG: reverse transcriptase/maturase family protein [Planctomycetota bacterium]|nr:reverse transcriptase/maturase family protein [Planctomycetota bacterium]